MTRLLLPAAALLAVALPYPALSWSGPGHEIVAAIAEARLSPAARRLVHDLIGKESLAAPDIATWADTHRNPTTGPWHYVNIPFRTTYEPTRDCRKGCAVSAITHAVAHLKSQEPLARRIDALRWLVHAVGDLHQPLHASDGWDRGGNSFQVRLGRQHQPTNFHRVWDTTVLVPLLQAGGPLSAAGRLAAAITPRDGAAWAAELDPAQWAQESNTLAATLYAELDRRPTDTEILTLAADYPAKQQARVELALEHAGVRLAALLDRIAVGPRG